MLTREIRNEALLWEGEVPESWEFIGMAENRWCRFRYYKDRQQYYYTAQRKKKEREYETRTRSENGVEFARVMPAGLGRWGAGW